MYVKTTDGLSADAQKAVEHAVSAATCRTQNPSQRFAETLNRKENADVRER